MTDQQHDSARSDRAAFYSEKLTVPVWWYPFGLFVGFLLALEFVFVLPPRFALVPIVLVLGATILIVRRLSSGRIEVVPGTLTAGAHELDVTLVQHSIPLDPVSLRRLVGRHSDPTCVAYIRSWIGPGVQLVLDVERQPADTSVPYWVVSTRNPQALLAAVDAAQVKA